MRRQIFERKLNEIRQHNYDPTKPWKLGVNQFTDRTDEEFKQVLGVRKELINHKRKLETAKMIPKEKIDIPALEQMSVDWRAKGIITSVKDQGMCGSCWSFATAETLESYWALSTKQLTDLSEQQILDCTPNPNNCGGTGGCGGGTVEIAYAQINVQGGLSTEWTYPYQSYGGSNFQCRFSSNTPPFAKVTSPSYIDLPSNQYAPLLQQVATGGPVAISVDASTWASYEGGVYDGCNKTNPDLDHAVQLVGYGTDPNYGDFWLVRNSWSPAWGEDGYIRLKRTSTPTCGKDLTPGDGDGCNGGPPTVTVCGTCGILYDTVYPIVSTN
jgi:cathepsin L